MNEYLRAMTTQKQEYVLCAVIKRKIHVNVSSKNYKTSTLEDDDIDIMKT